MAKVYRVLVHNWGGDPTYHLGDLVNVPRDDEFYYDIASAVAHGDIEYVSGENDPAGGGEAGLVGWETDDDGNLVCTGTGAILPDSYASPIVIKSHFDVDGPPDDDSGVFFRLVSDTWDYAGTPENKTILEVNEYARLLLFKAGFNLGWRHDSGGQINWSPLDDSVNFATIACIGDLSGNKPGAWTLQVRDTGGNTMTQISVRSAGGITLGAVGGGLAFFGADTFTQQTIAAAATDAASTQALANSIRDILILHSLVGS